MANHKGQRENWVKFLASGENPEGMVSQVPDEVMKNGHGNESPVGGESDPTSPQAESSYIQVASYKRRRR
jgi:hypothetical protein